MCTTLIAGRNAALSGRAMLGANDDWDGVPGVLTRVMPQRHLPGAEYLLTGGFRIPEAESTFGYSYTACRYSIGTLDKGWAGGVNDAGVAVAGTGASAFRAIPCEEAWLEPDDIPLLILRRADSARGAIRLIGELTERYGIHPSRLDGCESMATFAVADAKEGWMLEMAPGNHWVAVRVPDDEAAVRANAYGTHHADLTDRENVMASEGLADYARAQGWWQGEDTDFDFAFTYGADKSPNEWGPELDPMNLRRRWRAMELLSGKPQDENGTVYSVRPDRKLTKQDFMTVLRDVYAGTAYDLMTAPDAGRWGNPFHDDPPSYSICKIGTIASFVAELYEDAPSVMWTAITTPAMSAYVPVYTGISALPGCFDTDDTEDSLFWELKELGYLIQRRYSRYHALVRPELDALEQRFFAYADARREKLLSLTEDERAAECTSITAAGFDALRSLCREERSELIRMY